MKETKIEVQNKYMNEVRNYQSMRIFIIMLGVPQKWHILNFFLVIAIILVHQTKPFPKYWINSRPGNLDHMVTDTWNYNEFTYRFKLIIL